MKTPLFLLATLGVLGSLAQGQNAPPPDSLDLEDGELSELVPPDRQAGRPDTVRWSEAVPVYPYTLTISPFHLLGFMSVEASIERAITPHYSLSLFGGVGTIPTLFGAKRDPGLDLQEIGAQVRWYPRAPARWNPHFGLEGFWGRADFRQDLSEDEGDWFVLDFSGVWTAWGGGPFVGTKYVSHDQFVFEIQAGYQAGYVTDETGTVNFLTFPIINLNLGRAF